MVHWRRTDANETRITEVRFTKFTVFFPFKDASLPKVVHPFGNMKVADQKYRKSLSLCASIMSSIEHWIYQALHPTALFLLGCQIWMWCIRLWPVAQLLLSSLHFCCHVMFVLKDVAWIFQRYVFIIKPHVSAAAVLFFYYQPNRTQNILLPCGHCALQQLLPTAVSVHVRVKDIHIMTRPLRGVLCSRLYPPPPTNCTLQTSWVQS